MTPKQIGINIALHPDNSALEVITGLFAPLLTLTVVLGTLAILLLGIKALWGFGSERTAELVAGFTRVLLMMLVLSSLGTLVSWIVSVAPSSSFIKSVIGAL